MKRAMKCKARPPGHQQCWECCPRSRPSLFLCHHLRELLGFPRATGNCGRWQLRRLVSQVSPRRQRKRPLGYRWAALPPPSPRGAPPHAAGTAPLPPQLAVPHLPPPSEGLFSLPGRAAPHAPGSGLRQRRGGRQRPGSGRSHLLHPAALTRYSGYSYM